MSTILANPAEMIAHGAPRVIHNDAELDAYTDALLQLTALQKPSPSESEAIELLTLLVERYKQTTTLSQRLIRLELYDFSLISNI